MEALSIVPQLFFDIIARIVPGAVFILGFKYAANKNLLEIFFSDFLKEPDFQKSVGLWVSAFLFVSYLVGNLLAPLVRVVEKERKPSDTGRPDDMDTHIFPFQREPPPRGEALLKSVMGANEGGSSANQTSLPRHLISILEKEVGDVRKEKFRSLIFVWYDWLRIKYPSSAGQLTAKIRAEYTMYGGLAVALMTLLALNVFTVWARLIFYNQDFHINHPLLLFLTVILIPILLARHKDTFGVFQLSVINFYLNGRMLQSEEKMANETAAQRGAANQPPTTIK